jgi:hypothetical protein
VFCVVCGSIFFPVGQTAPRVIAGGFAGINELASLRRQYKENGTAKHAEHANGYGRGRAGFLGNVYEMCWCNALPREAEAGCQVLFFGEASRSW